jgi:hypothetical protein
MSFRIPCLLVLAVATFLQLGCASDGSPDKPNSISDDGNGWGAGFQMK